MAKFVLILLIALVFEAIGVVFLSGGLKEIGEPKHINVSEILGVIKRGATNKSVLTGVFFEAVFFGFLLYLLSQRDVSLVWPLTALGFVVTTIAAKIFLHEKVSALRWAGIFLIVAGAALNIWSEKQKERERGALPKESTSADSGLR